MQMVKVWVRGSKVGVCKVCIRVRRNGRSVGVGQPVSVHTESACCLGDEVCACCLRRQSHKHLRYQCHDILRCQRRQQSRTNPKRKGIICPYP